MGIWAKTPVAVDLVGRSHFQLTEIGARLTIQSEVRVTSLWCTMQPSVSVSCHGLTT